MSLEFPLDILDRDTMDALEGTSGEPSDSNRYVTSTDTRLTSGMSYQGSWNAATNTPTLVNGTGSNGSVYAVSVAGTRNFGAGDITFAKDDWAYYNGSIWTKQASSGLTLTTTITPSAITGATPAIGTATTAAKADHAHAHGNQTLGTLHAVATPTTNGFMSAADKQAINEFAAPGSLPLNRFDLYKSTLTTSSATAQVYRTWNAANLEATTYLVKWNVKFTTIEYRYGAQMKLFVDGVELLALEMAPAYDSDESVGAITAGLVTFTTAGTHTFTAYLSSSQNGKWVRMYASFIELVRTI